MPDTPFWKRKTLRDMTPQEWESLCDGCARCCLVKLEEDVGDEASAEAQAAAKIFYTDVGCRLLDPQTCRCRDYANRLDEANGCVRIDAAAVEEIGWLPPTCGYRLVDEGKDLPWWHPLVSGDPQTVVWAGISARGRVQANEDDVPDDELEDRIVSWPLKWPKLACDEAKARAKAAAPPGKSHVRP